MSTFDEALGAFNLALNDYLNGNPGPVHAVYSRWENVTLCNPVGPPRRGPQDVERAAAEPSSHFMDGKIVGFDEVSRLVTEDMGYVVRIERGQARVDGSNDFVPYALRVTLIFRREGEAWKMVHRDADPITTTRPLTTAMQSA